MNVPGFTAEASLYKSSGSRAISTAFEPVEVNTIVYPQLSRATGPYGPIGFPGQDCSGACWHVCATFGGGPISGPYFDRCVVDCMSTCVGSLFNIW
jgi:hypothetical protein